MELTYPYISGYGDDWVTLYLNGYPLAQQAHLRRRGPDLKSGGPTPPPCSGDVICSDGKVTNADLSYFLSRYPTSQNPNPAYVEQCDFKEPFGAPLGMTDFSFMVYHFQGSGHANPFSEPLLAVGDEPIVPAHVAMVFTEEYVTSIARRFYVDLALEDCAGNNWCLFAIRSNRPDMTFLEWRPTEWASENAPFAAVERADGRDLYVGAIMMNDTDVSSRNLGRLVFEVAGSDPISISDDEFILTVGEVELAAASTGSSLVVGDQPLFAHMSGASGRTLTPVARVFHNRLEQNFPNPFNPQTTLAYSLKDASNVSLTIYDVAGRRVRDLVDEHRVPGAYKVVWDGRDGNGTQVASGVYFYKLVAGSFVDTKKMTILK